MLLPVLADVGITVLLIACGLLTASLTLLSEGIRSLVMLFASVYALVVMRAIHRSRLGHFEFGVGKLEQFVTLVVGLGLIGSALWVADSAVAKAFGAGGAVPSPLGLALAAVVNAINAAINTLGWLAMTMAGRGDDGGDSEIYRAQRRARAVMMGSSLLLQVTLTAAALAKDAGVAALLDVAGASFVAVLMLVNGLALLRRALPELLDAPPARHLAAHIREVVAGHVPPGALAGVRARRAGGKVLAEVVLCGDDCRPGTLERRRRAIEAALAAAGTEVELAMTVAAAAPAQPAEAAS